MLRRASRQSLNAHAPRISSGVSYELQIKDLTPWLLKSRASTRKQERQLALPLLREAIPQFNHIDDQLQSGYCQITNAGKYQPTREKRPGPLRGGSARTEGQKNLYATESLKNLPIGSPNCGL